MTRNLPGQVEGGERLSTPQRLQDGTMLPGRDLWKSSKLVSKRGRYGAHRLPGEDGIMGYDADKFIAPMYSPAEARLRDSGVSVWAIVESLRLMEGARERVVADFDISLEALDAALAYYERHKDVIDAKITLNAA